MNIRTLIHTLRSINLQRWYMPLIFVTVFYISFFTIFTPIYETNDDVFFTLIANGYYTKTPTPFFQMNPGIQTMHVIIGKLLVLLYTSFPGLNWYSILLYSIAFLSIYALLLPILFNIKNKWLLTIILTSFFIFLSRILLYLSFTSIAAIGSMGGIFLLVFCITSKKSTPYYMLAIFLLLISQLIRQGSFIMIFVFMFPVLVHSFIFKRRYKVFLLITVISAISVFIVSQTNIAAYQKNNEWNTRKDFLLTLGSFFYAPSILDYENNTQLYKSVQWSPNDYRMFTNFSYDDEKIFTATTLQKITSTMKSSNIRIDLVKNIPIYFLLIILRMFEYILMSILIFIIGSKYISAPDKKNIYATAIIIAGFFAYFFYNGYLPPRVIYSALFFFCYLIMFCVGSKQNIEEKVMNNKYFILTSFYLALIAVILSQFFQYNALNKKKIANFKKIMAQLPARKTDLTLIWGSSIPYEWQYVFSNNAEFKDLHFLIGSWTQRSPLNDLIKKEFHIKNIYIALFTNKNTYLLAGDAQRKILETYMREHYKITIGYDEKYNFNEYAMPTKLLQMKRF